VQRFAEEQSKAFEVWVKAREAADFAQFRPNLETLVDLLREKADLIGYDESPYDALLVEFERGVTAEDLKEVFSELARSQGDLVARIAKAPRKPDTAWTEQDWSEGAQWELTLRVLEDMGYDFDAGRQDKSVHPFTTNFDLYDVRLTTRVNKGELFSALTGSIHEGGHGLYEQGFLPMDQRTVLAEAPSLGMHESQSRMWENMIGRSLPFWRHYTPALREFFPGQADDVRPEQVYEAINRVEPSFIRVEADECTYNLHIIIRFEIEVAVMEGDLAVADIPGMWNAKVKEYLGLDVPDDARGCLQDIHWAHGAMGYFPTYALGNLYAAQIFERILHDVPNLWIQIESGDLSGLRDWLREHVHQVGRRQLAPQLVEELTGAPPSAAAYLRYLESKYGELYGL
ncbi:MAG: carboxypeptidase M32, partial [bacterium]|nr:carboxypeptidase M32 [bacterium]